MQNLDYPQTEPHPKPTGFFHACWRAIGGGSLAFAICLHVVLLGLGALWVFQIIHPKEKTVDFTQKGGGGGARGAESTNQTKKLSRIAPSTQVRRVVADGAVSNFTIPEPTGEFGQFSSLVSPSGGSLGGGGFGTSGNQRGFGDPGGSGIGVGTHGTATINPFGLTDPSENALIGTFYDLKQTPKAEPTDISVGEVKSVISDFVNSNWNERRLNKYFRAKRTLYQNRVMIPLMSAESAPAAFGCEKEVKPSRWLVIYRGMVTPPKSGKFRFIGAGDDVMVVRFGGKVVFDHGYTSGTMGMDISQNLAFFRDGAENDALKKAARKSYPMKIPVTYFRYSETQRWNQDIGGIAAGAEFRADSGRSYPIEILISEIPGGLFCASLLIEEVGQNYRKSSDGMPIFPLFRLDQSLPEIPTGADNAPPFATDGPVWKRVPGGIHDLP